MGKTSPRTMTKHARTAIHLSPLSPNFTSARWSGESSSPFSLIAADCAIICSSGTPVTWAIRFKISSLAGIYVCSHRCNDDLDTYISWAKALMEYPLLSLKFLMYFPFILSITKIILYRSNNVKNILWRFLLINLTNFAFWDKTGHLPPPYALTF